MGNCCQWWPREHALHCWRWMVLRCGWKLLQAAFVGNGVGFPWEWNWEWSGFGRVGSLARSGLPPASNLKITPWWPSSSLSRPSNFGSSLPTTGRRSLPSGPSFTKATTSLVAILATLGPLTFVRILEIISCSSGLEPPESKWNGTLIRKMYCVKIIQIIYFNIPWALASRKLRLTVRTYRQQRTKLWQSPISSWASLWLIALIQVEKIKWVVQ